MIYCDAAYHSSVAHHAWNLFVMAEQLLFYIIRPVCKYPYPHNHILPPRLPTNLLTSPMSTGHTRPLIVMMHASLVSGHITLVPIIVTLYDSTELQQQLCRQSDILHYVPNL